MNAEKEADRERRGEAEVSEWLSRLAIEMETDQPMLANVRDGSGSSHAQYRMNTQD